MFCSILPLLRVRGGYKEVLSSSRGRAQAEGKDAKEEEPAEEAEEAVHLDRAAKLSCGTKWY